MFFNLSLMPHVCQQPWLYLLMEEAGVNQKTNNCGSKTGNKQKQTSTIRDLHF